MNHIIYSILESMKYRSVLQSAQSDYPMKVLDYNIKELFEKNR